MRVVVRRLELVTGVAKELCERIVPVGKDSIDIAFHDLRHNFVLSGSYDLPLGKGRKWGSDWSEFRFSSCPVATV